MSHRSDDKPEWKPERRNRPDHQDAAEGPHADEQRRSRNWIYGVRDDGRESRFVKTPDVYNDALPLDLAYFLGILTDWDRRKSDAVNDGWFYFPARVIAERFPHVTRKVQRRLFRELLNRGFIRTRMSYGKKATHRWIWVDYRAIQKACLDAKYGRLPD